jgi:hypothetical protein
MLHTLDAPDNNAVTCAPQGDSDRAFGTDRAGISPGGRKGTVADDLSAEQVGMLTVLCRQAGIPQSRMADAMRWCGKTYRDGQDSVREPAPTGDPAKDAQAHLDALGSKSFGILVDNLSSFKRTRAKQAAAAIKRRLKGCNSSSRRRKPRPFDWCD